jgi:hypothetical protein
MVALLALRKANIVSARNADLEDINQLLTANYNFFARTTANLSSAHSADEVEIRRHHQFLSLSQATRLIDGSN